QSFRGEFQLLVHPGYVVGWNVCTENGREMINLLFGLAQLFVRQGPVRRAEIDGARQKLPDATAGANRLIVDLNIRVELMVFVEPLRVDRIGEGGARAVDLKSVGWRRRRTGRKGGRKPQQENRADHRKLQKRSDWFFQLVFSAKGIRASFCQWRPSPPSPFISFRSVAGKCPF